MLRKLASKLNRERDIDDKPSVRERLDAFSRFRIRSREISFAPGADRRSGGKADVIQASWDNGRYLSEEEVVAVKKIRNVKTEKARKEFAHEVGLMASMSHKYIVKFVGFVEELENGTAWIVLPWEPNGNVSEFLARGSYEIPERISLIQDTFKGVRYLHTREPPICHGDLKSLNILISSSYRAVITDFGSAREISARESETTSDESGQPRTTGQSYPPIHVAAAGKKLTLTGPAWTLRWASPEIVNGERPSLSSDIWAAGWVCWEVMTNTLPFHELNSVSTITLAAINGEVPSPREDEQLGQIVALCTLMTSCWAFDPKSRPRITQCCNRLQWMPAIPPAAPYRSYVYSVHRSTQILIKKGWMHYQKGDHTNAASLLRRAVSLAESEDDQAAIADASRRLASAYRMLTRFTEAEESYIRAKNIYTRIRDAKGRANALKGLGDLYLLQSKYTEAEELFTEAKEVYTQFGNDRGLASALRGLGDIYCDQSKYTEAEKSLAQAQEIYARIGSDSGRGDALIGLGEVYRRQYKYTEAEQSFKRAQAIFARTGDNRGRADALRGLGNVYRLQSKYHRAEESYSRALEIHASVGDEVGQANALTRIGDLRRSQGHDVEAALYYFEARDLNIKIGRTKNAEAISKKLASLSPGPNSSITSPQECIAPNPLSTDISS